MKWPFVMRSTYEAGLATLTQAHNATYAELHDKERAAYGELLRENWRLLDKLKYGRRKGRAA